MMDHFSTASLFGFLWAPLFYCLVNREGVVRSPNDPSTQLVTGLMEFQYRNKYHQNVTKIRLMKSIAFHGVASDFKIERKLHE